MGKKLYIIDSCNSKREAVELLCPQCGKKFLRAKRFVKEGQTSYCSRECAQKGHRKCVTVVCAVCGEKKDIPASRFRSCKSKLFFCSKKCKDEGQKVKNGMTRLWPAHYSTGQSKYRDLCFAVHEHKCCVCGESIILDVHHYDRNKKNSDPRNLIPLCPTHHRYMHSKYKYLIEDIVKDYISSIKV